MIAQNLKGFIMRSDFTERQLAGVKKELDTMESIQAYDLYRLHHLQGKVFLIYILYNNYINNIKILQEAKELRSKINSMIEIAQEYATEQDRKEVDLIDFTIDKKALINSINELQEENIKLKEQLSDSVGNSDDSMSISELQEEIKQLKGQLKGKNMEIGRLKARLEKLGGNNENSKN